MEHWGTGPEDWTREHVEARLVAAFRLMPGMAIRRLGSRVRNAGGGRSIVTETLSWAAFLEHDPDGERYLMAWAACRARGDVFADLCRARHWPRATAERGRRRAADTIAAALSRGLDSEKTGTAA